MMLLGQYEAELIHNIGSVKCGTGVYLVVLGQSNLVLGQNNLVPIGIKWNWISTRLLCLYILKKKKWRLGQMA